MCLKDKRDVDFKDKVKSMYGDEYIPLTKYNRMNYVFIKKYICDRNMNISGRYVQIKNSEEEVA